jgi:hypothetical protein
MLGVTSYITTDIAAIPLLWIIPFALYLISFILVFSPNITGYEICKKIFPYMVIGTLAINIFFLNIYTFLLIIVCFLCVAIRYHGELVTQKPEAHNLTYFYLWLSIGGALGGLFNAIIAPIIYSSSYEYHIILILSLIILIKLKTPKEYLIFIMPSMIVIHIWLAYHDDIFRERNFFGVSRVLYDDKLKANKYIHGTTNHGMQSKLEEYRLKPQAYYTGVHDFIDLLPDDVQQKPVAITGLGIGTLACYIKDNQDVDIYEIDPVVIKIANNDKLFTYMRDCKGNKNTILGDARINLQKASEKKYGIMLMDAYSSDSLPIHLLTKEALQIYLDKLDDNGVIAFHISNRHLDLKPVLSGLSDALNLTGYSVIYKHKPMSKNDLRTTNEWVLLSKNPNIFQKISNNKKWQPLDNNKQILWTDDYSSIFSILKLKDK